MATEQRKLQAYIIRQVLAAQDDVMPEILDTIGGTTEAEVDQSVAKAKDATARLLTRVRQEAARPADVDPVGTRADQLQGFGNPPMTEADLAARVSQMSMSEWAWQRDSLIGRKDMISFLGGA